jgi:ABC-type iron transport system FetAB ATPase subunit
VNFQRKKGDYQLNQVGQEYQGAPGALARFFSSTNFLKDGRAPPHTPQLRQSAITECGLIALAIIFAWHGVEVSLEKLRNEVGSSRLGLTARQLLELARRYDFDSKAYRREIDQLATLPRPFIAHSRFIHFVVVEEISPEYVIINDPGCGPQRLTLEEFAKDFTGIALTFVPRRVEALAPVHPARREFWLQLKEARIPATIFLLLCVLQVSAVMAGLITIAPVFDGALRPDYALIAWVSAAILHILLHWSSECWTDRLAREAQKLVWHRFKNMPPNWFAAKTSSQLADLMTLGERWPLLFPDILSLLRALLSMPVLMVAPLISLSSGLFVLSLTAIASCITAAACLRRGETRMRRIKPERLLALPDAQILGDLESRQFGGRDTELAAQLAGDHARIHSQAQLNLDFQTKLDLWIALPLVIALMVSMAEGLLNKNWGTATALGAICAIAGFCLMTARRNAPATNDLMGLLSRLHDLRNTEASYVASQQSQETSDGLRIQVLETELVVKRGGLLQLTGPSGSGKTRLARQIAGLEPCPKGTITYGGHATEMLCHQGSSQVMFVDQHVHLISASLADNLCLGETRFERSALDGVLELVELKPELDARGGLDLMLCPNRRLLSGGQLRRLALARVLLRQPSVIVLDGVLDALHPPLAERIVERLRQRYALVLVGERGMAARGPDAIIDLGMP